MDRWVLGWKGSETKNGSILWSDGERKGGRRETRTRIDCERKEEKKEGKSASFSDQLTHTQGSKSNIPRLHRHTGSGGASPLLLQLSFSKRKKSECERTSEQEGRAKWRASQEIDRNFFSQSPFPLFSPTVRQYGGTAIAAAAALATRSLSDVVREARV